MPWSMDVATTTGGGIAGGTATVFVKDIVGSDAPMVSDTIAVGAEAVAVADRDVVADGDVVLLLSSTVWDPCDGVGVRVTRDGDRVAQNAVTDGDADNGVERNKISQIIHEMLITTNENIVFVARGVIHVRSFMSPNTLDKETKLWAPGRPFLRSPFRASARNRASRHHEQTNAVS